MRGWARALVLAGLVVASACGDDEEVADPKPVDVALAPATIPPDLKLYENRDPATVETFANPSKNTIVADARIWEIRRVDRLIGTLQITTLLPDVELSELSTRLTLVRQILASEPVSIRIGDTEVYQVRVGDKATFVWFGDHMMEVMQLRERGLEDFEPYAAAVIEHQQTQPSWVPLSDLIGAGEGG
jgi:hypothetical protein